MKIINHTVYKGNPYTAALYSSLAGRYEPIKGDIDSAIAELKANKLAVLHLHWEEHVIRHSLCPSEARQLIDFSIARLEYFKKLGGIVLWTVHNAMPHEMQFPEIFLGYRRKIAALADRILVHNVATITLLSEQGVNYPSKTTLLPHPSYLGVYQEVPPDVSAVVPMATCRSILAFGLVRKYKNLERLLIDLDPEFTRQHGLHIRISGATLPGDDYSGMLVERAAGRTDVTLDFRHIPQEEVASVMERAGCVILPYERFLTSGAALLAMSFGKIIIGPNTSQFLEILPKSSHRYLYGEGNREDLKRAVVDVLGMTEDEHRMVVADLLDRAEYFSPQRISGQLGQIIESLVGKRRQSLAEAAAKRVNETTKKAPPKKAQTPKKRKFDFLRELYRKAMR